MSWRLLNYPVGNFVQANVYTASITLLWNKEPVIYVTYTQNGANLTFNITLTLEWLTGSKKIKQSPIFIESMKNIIQIGLSICQNQLVKVTSVFIYLLKILNKAKRLTCDFNLKYNPRVLTDKIRYSIKLYSERGTHNRWF